MNNKILLVDDNEIMLEIIGDMLDTQNLEHVKCNCAKRAYELIEKDIYSMAILDINLQDGHGLDLLDAIKKRNQFTICYIITGAPKMHMLSEFIAHGADDFFAKGQMDMKHILDTVQLGFKKQANWRSLFSLFGTQYQTEEL